MACQIGRNQDADDKSRQAVCSAWGAYYLACAGGDAAGSLIALAAELDDDATIPPDIRRAQHRKEIDELQR